VNLENKIKHARRNALATVYEVLGEGVSEQLVRDMVYSDLSLLDESEENIESIVTLAHSLYYDVKVSLD